MTLVLLLSCYTAPAPAPPHCAVHWTSPDGFGSEAMVVDCPPQILDDPQAHVCPQEPDPVQVQPATPAGGTDVIRSHDGLDTLNGDSPMDDPFMNDGVWTHPFEPCVLTAR